MKHVIAPVLIFGAATAVGRALVAAALADGYPVLAVDEDHAGLDALQHQHAGAPIQILPHRLRKAADITAMVDAIGAHTQHLSGVVVDLSGLCGGDALSAMPAQVLQSRLDEVLIPHLFLARRLLSMLPHDRPVPGYILIGNVTVQHSEMQPGYCMVVGAALQMMARVLEQEAARVGRSIRLLPADPAVGEVPPIQARAVHGTSPEQRIAARALALLQVDAPPPAAGFGSGA